MTHRLRTTAIHIVLCVVCNLWLTTLKILSVNLHSLIVMYLIEVFLIISQPLDLWDAYTYGFMPFITLGTISAIISSAGSVFSCPSSGGSSIHRLKFCSLHPPLSHSLCFVLFWIAAVGMSSGLITMSYSVQSAFNFQCFLILLYFYHKKLNMSLLKCFHFFS